VTRFGEISTIGEIGIVTKINDDCFVTFLSIFTKYFRGKLSYLGM
jgi:hypothetical protein